MWLHRENVVGLTLNGDALLNFPHLMPMVRIFSMERCVCSLGWSSDSAWIVVKQVLFVCVETSSNAIILLASFSRFSRKFFHRNDMEEFYAIQIYSSWSKQKENHIKFFLLWIFWDIEICWTSMRLSNFSPNSIDRNA